MPASNIGNKHVIAPLFRALLLLITAVSLDGRSRAVADDEHVITSHYRFEDGLAGLTLSAKEAARVVKDGPSDNHLLELSPIDQDLSFVILDEGPPTNSFVVKGRFLFPEVGDGYLGFIWGFNGNQARLDYNSIYLKQNGNYLRVSPHFDGNPSWRLYEEMRVDLGDDRRLRVETWHTFQLNIVGSSVQLILDDRPEPAGTFTMKGPGKSGSVGFEARPRGGKPVWLDDVTVEYRANVAEDTDLGGNPNDVLSWEYIAVDDLFDRGELPHTDMEGHWQPFHADTRGALVTARIQRYRSPGPSTMLLRTRFLSTAGSSLGWLAISTANDVDVWLNSNFRGTAGAGRFIWADHTDNGDHLGHRIPLNIAAGCNELVLQVHGKRFAGGGLYADLMPTNLSEIKHCQRSQMFSVDATLPIPVSQ